MTAPEAIKRIFDKLWTWIDALILMLPNLIIALLVVILFAALSRLVSRLSAQLLKRISSKEAINTLVTKTAALIVILIGLLTALSVLNLDKTVTSLLAGVGVIGLALGFAFQDIASNFMSGIIISLQHPCDVGDLIKTSNFTGKVERIALRSTTIRTFQGPLVMIPNKDILQGPLTNFTRSGHRRVELRVGVSYSDDLEEVQRVAISAVSAMSCRNAEREVEVHFEEFDDSSVNFVLWIWINFAEERDYVSAKSEAIIRIKKAFDAKNITIPFPIRTLELDMKRAEAMSKRFLSTSIEDVDDPRKRWKGSGKAGAEGTEFNAEGGEGEDESEETKGS